MRAGLERGDDAVGRERGDDVARRRARHLSAFVARGAALRVERGAVLRERRAAAIRIDTTRTAGDEDARIITASGVRVRRDDGV